MDGGLGSQAKPAIFAACSIQEILEHLILGTRAVEKGTQDRRLTEGRTRRAAGKFATLFLTPSGEWKGREGEKARQMTLN